MESKRSWRNKSSLREKYALMNLLGKTPLEVADPIATINYFPNNSSSSQNPELK